MVRDVVRSGCAVAVASTVLGCTASLLGPDDEGAPIRTDATEYALEPESGGLGTEIAYTFTNVTGADVYVVNCNGAFALHLERQVGDEWEVAWVPAIPQCLSQPIVIEPGERSEHTLHVWAALPGEEIYPQWDTPDLDGVYRIVWTDALTSFDGSDYPFGEDIPLEARVSNGFRLEVE